MLPGEEQEEDEAEPPADSRESPQIAQVCVFEASGNARNRVFPANVLPFCASSIICAVRRERPTLPRSSGNRRTAASRGSWTCSNRSSSSSGPRSVARPWFFCFFLRSSDRRLRRHLSSPSQAQRCVTELKAQVYRLEAEVEEQRTHRQLAAVENQHLRMEVEGLRSATAAGAGAQIGLKEADSECKDSAPPPEDEGSLTDPAVAVGSESPGGRASLLPAEGETRRADQQPRRPDEEGKHFLFLGAGRGS